MIWFTNKKKRLEMMQGLKPTSKATLKIQCLLLTKGDIDEAEKLYDYFAKDMPELPAYDPVPPTWVDNTKDMANSLMGWLKDNQNTLVQGYEFIRNIANNKTLPPVTPPAESPLPPINE